MAKSLKDTKTLNFVYETQSDEPFYLFLETATYLLDVPHYHDSFELIYLIHGKSKAHVGNKSYPLNAGDIFIVNSQQVHFYENPPEDKEALIVVFGRKYLHSFKQLYQGQPFPPLLRNKKYNQEIYELLLKWLDFEEKTFLSDCAFANLLLDKIIKLYGFSTPDDHNAVHTLATKFINYINENYEKPLTLEETAQHFGYSREYFSKLFKRTVGKNFLPFVNATRTQKAMELIADAEKKHSIQEICATCGFNNPVSLYRNLKKNTPPTK
jgi:AraC-like DNA-binding protein